MPACVYTHIFSGMCTSIVCSIFIRLVDSFVGCNFRNFDLCVRPFVYEFESNCITVYCLWCAIYGQHNWSHKSYKHRIEVY